MAEASLLRQRPPVIAAPGSGRQLSARPPAVVFIPALVVGAAAVLPVAYLVVRTAGAGTEPWELLFRQRTLDVLGRSLGLVAAVTAASVLIALPLAWLTVRTDLPFRRVWAVLTALPLVIPSYIAGFIVVTALGPQGILTPLVAWPFGIERLPSPYGFPGAAVTLALLSYPYVLLTVRSALWRLDPAFEETSRSLGHGPWTTFRRVTLPLLRPAIASGSILVALYTLSDFGAVSLLRYETFTLAIYVQYESAFDRNVAAALSLVVVALALSILLFDVLAARGPARWSPSGATRPGGTVRLGRWRGPAVAFCGAIVALTLALPLSILGYWVVSGVSHGEPLVVLWGALRNSVYVSLLAAVAVVLASIPVAVLSVRYPRWSSTLLERATHIGFALPGIAVALALVLFGARYGGPLYQTLPLLVLGYLVLFLPAAVGSVRASLMQVRPRIEEAARSLGRSPLQTLITITLPLVLPGVLAGASLVFLLTMKELPATLILSPLGFDTLATSLWSASIEGFFARAAMPALLLILASAAALAFLMRQDRRWYR